MAQTTVVTKGENRKVYVNYAATTMLAVFVNTIVRLLGTCTLSNSISRVVTSVTMATSINHSTCQVADYCRSGSTLA